MWGLFQSFPFVLEAGFRPHHFRSEVNLSLAPSVKVIESRKVEQILQKNSETVTKCSLLFDRYLVTFILMEKLYPKKLREMRIAHV